MDFASPGWIILYIIVGLILLFFVYVFYQAFSMIFGFIHSVKKEVLPIVQTDMDNFDQNISDREFNLCGKSVCKLCKANSGPNSLNATDLENKLSDIVTAYIDNNVKGTQVAIENTVEILNTKVRIHIYYKVL